MKYRVYARILNFVKHIHMQDIETNLSKQVLSEQIKHGWPGQVHLAKNLCEALNITGLLDPEVSRSQFKS